MSPVTSCTTEDRSTVSPMAEAAFLYFLPYKMYSLSVEQIARGQDSLFASITILTVPDLVCEADLSLGVSSLGDPNQSGPADAGSRQDLAPMSKDMEAFGLAPEWGPLMFMVSLLRFRTPSTRKLYSLKWWVFEYLCARRRQDPICVHSVLDFLHEQLTTGVAYTTLRIYMVAIAAK